jgi:hypothetical protein
MGTLGANVNAAVFVRKFRIAFWACWQSAHGVILLGKAIAVKRKAVYCVPMAFLFLSDRNYAERGIAEKSRLGCLPGALILRPVLFKPRIGHANLLAFTNNTIGQEQSFPIGHKSRYMQSTVTDSGVRLTEACSQTDI